MKFASHYDWLNEHLMTFFEAIGINTEWYSKGLISAHGDKCYSYKFEWNEAGIPFEHGVAIYLLTYCSPFSQESRETENGWVDPWEWVIANYERFKPFLPVD